MKRRSAYTERTACIEELIKTEEVYVRDIALITDVFLKPIRETRVMTVEEIDLVFVNLNDIIACSNALLNAFRVRQDTTDGAVEMIGDVMCDHIPNFTPYIRFCSCQLKAAALIQKKFETDSDFRRVMKECSMNRRVKQAMPLSSFLLKPMQRITKYPLFLEKILKSTPDTHNDYNNLQRAHKMALEFCNKVNDGARECDNSIRLEWVQQHVNCDALTDEKITFNSVTNCLGNRKFLLVGSLYKAKSNKELVAFLFNDFLLLTQPTKPLGNHNILTFEKCYKLYFRMYRQPLFLNEIIITKPTESEGMNIFIVRHVKRLYSFRTSMLKERDEWVHMLETFSKEYHDTEKMCRAKPPLPVLQQKPAVGRLLVVIMEGIDLVSDLNARDRLDPKGRLFVTIVDGERLMSTKAKGKLTSYCDVNMGAQMFKTKIAPDSLNPKWNAPMQFIIKDLVDDVLSITVYDKDYFSPDSFLGKTEIRIAHILQECKSTEGPIVRTLMLSEVETGKISVKLDIQLFEA